ncbi:lysozyme [uncultured Bacteroides sp.]|uniref:lysozyme n=1 Tax=uncultured Bacteroides sp. TaxID=162156 RepID=UPI002AAA7BE6|nr:lysozyme [uncultured Bacteroides sp.]
MKASDILINKLMEFEGVKLTSYKCPAGKWTIGIGHTQGVKPGQTITYAQAITLLKGDLLEFEKQVNSLDIALTQGRFDALVDFAYNCKGWRNSTLIRKTLVNVNDESIPNEFRRWVYADGKRLDGLVKRREWEAQRWEEK